MREDEVYPTKKRGEITEIATISEPSVLLSASLEGDGCAMSRNFKARFDAVSSHTPARNYRYSNRK
jgi:hypothetical protein